MTPEGISAVAVAERINEIAPNRPLAPQGCCFDCGDSLHDVMGMVVWGPFTICFRCAEHATKQYPLVKLRADMEKGL